MKTTFHIDYRADAAQQLVLHIDPTGQRPGQTLSMNSMDNEHWTADAEAPDEDYTYYYTLNNGLREQRREWTVVKHRADKLATAAARQNGNRRQERWDHWLDRPQDAYLFSSAFTECINARRHHSTIADTRQANCVLLVRAPQLSARRRLAVVGDGEQLGEWQPARSIAMQEVQPCEWMAVLRLQTPAQLKFVAIDTNGEAAPEWEEGPNRIIAFPTTGAQDAMLVYELPEAHFSTLPYRGAGTVIPVFALRSEGSFGVGDFGDLKTMLQWCAKTRQRVLQLLPINDTYETGTWQDSYPYNCISVFALHPQYIDLRQMPNLKDQARVEYYENTRKELNALPQIDYERMFNTKMAYLAELHKQQGANDRRTKAYKAFVEQNRSWLEPYAQRQAHLAKHIDGGEALWFWVQYHLDKQMKAAHEEARRLGIVLKGDIPIGVNRNGVDVATEPRYFNLNGQAGAPPDDFAVDGQNWGFPTYNWDAMLADGCQWWHRRFSKMAEYFDAYRIDHVLGFFRIWEIPVPEKSGLMGQFSPALGLSREEIEAYGVQFNDGLFLVDHKRNDRWHPRIAVQYQEAYNQLNEDQKYHFNQLYNDYFYRRNNQFWYTEAMKKLPKLTQATRMLVCAEDLGMVPDCVPWVMNELRILSLEIQSMPKDPTTRFGHLSRNPYRSVDTISTHDMPTLRQWWNEDEERTQSYFNTMLFRGGPAPHPLPDWLAKDIVSRHLTSPSMLCLLSFQDWISIDDGLRLPDENAERINIPANPRHYWRYRMHLTIEQLLAADDLNNEISTLIIQSGRK